MVTGFPVPYVFTLGVKDRTSSNVHVLSFLTVICDLFPTIKFWPNKSIQDSQVSTPGDNYWFRLSF